MVVAIDQCEKEDGWRGVEYLLPHIVCAEDCKFLDDVLLKARFRSNLLHFGVVVGCQAEH